MSNLYQGKNCPCKYTSCKYFGKCKECIAYHHNKGEQTYCEKLDSKKKKSNWIMDFFREIACPS